MHIRTKNVAHFCVCAWKNSAFEYNNVLSDQRALTVQTALEKSGIDSYRIERRAFGADKSQAINGDYEAYAMERRVDIEIYNPMIVSSLVQAH